MAATRPLTTAAKANATFNFIAAGAIVFLILTGAPGFPAIPPGPIILTVAGILVLALYSRFGWIALVGIIAPAFIFVGGLQQDSVFSALGNPADVLPFAGITVQMLSMAAAAVLGVVALVQALRKTPVH